MQSWILRPIFPASIVSLLSFIVYLFTMDPGLGYIDSGELATVCHELGIAHPTGYPLFTLIGWLFSHLPIPVSAILRLNIMAALFTTLAAGAVVYLIHEIVEHWRETPSALRKDPKSKQKEVVMAAEQLPLNGSIVGMIGGFIAAFSLTWWQQAASLEVYSLHILLITLAIFFLLRMLRKESSEAGKDALFFAITLGLAFTNHLTSVLLAPAMLYAFFARYGLGKNAFAKVGKLALPFAACLLIYLYLPLRAASDPILNWGDPSDWTQFWKHVTGGQYKIWMFTGSGAGANWSMFWSGLADQFSLPVCLLALAGLPALFVRRVHRVNLLVFFLLLFFGCLLYAINYDINDIQSYFLLAYLAIVVLAATGLDWIAGKVGNRKRVLDIALPLIIGVMMATNYEQADESENYLVEDYTRNMLTNLPKNAIVFSTQWDFWVSGALYYQLVEGLRPDVLVIDKHLMRDRPWYFAHLKQRAPEVMMRVEAESNAFLQHLVKFDRGEPFNEAAIAPAYQSLTTALIEKNPDRPILMTGEMAEERDELFAPGYKPSAGGIALALANAHAIVSAPKVKHQSTEYDKRGYYSDNTRRLQALPLSLTASHLTSTGNIQLAREYYDLALSLKPLARDNYDDLLLKEQDFARTTDAFFAQVEQMRAQLNSPTR
ncbi:MAG TPA: DUF2723 domain-containing protein [Candidatus Kapabacteria bacterium]|nr:DUF2723 domain-containing protein [Candidatus Kapabacteria bacterium]